MPRDYHIKVGSVATGVPVLDDGWDLISAPMDLSGIADNTLMTPAMFRDFWGITGDAYNVGTSNANLFKKITETGFGECICWTAVPNSKSGGLSAMPPLPGRRYGLSIMLEYDCKYAGPTDGSTWPWGPGQGGKLPGFGGNTVAGVIYGGNAPTGGSPVDTGISHRMMDIADNVGGDLATNDELIGYDYLPSQGSTFPPNTHLSPPGPKHAIGSNAFRVRAEYHMNSIASPGVGNPDGIRRIYVGPADTVLDASHLRYEETGIDDLRLYSNCYFDQQVFSVFRGGADDSWGPPSASRVLIKNYRLGMQRQAGTL